MHCSRMSRRRFLNWAAFAAGAALTGCATPAATPQPAEKVITKEVEKVIEKVVTAAPTALPDVKADITVWVWHNTEDILNPLMEKWHDSYYSNVTVHVEVLPFDDVHTKLQTTIAAGAGGPDLCNISSTKAGQFCYPGAKGRLTDLTPYAERDRIRERIAKGFYDALLDKTGTQLMALWWDISPAALIYRRDLLTERGLPSEPEELEAGMPTWEKWLELGVQYSDPQAELWWCPAVDGVDGPLNSSLKGADFFDKNGNLRVGSDPRLEELVGYHVEARRAGMDAGEGVWSQEGQAIVKQGNVATIMIGIWYSSMIANYAPETSGNWGAIRIPEVKGANEGGSCLVVPQYTSHPDLAWEYAKFLVMDPDAIRALAAISQYGAFTASLEGLGLLDWQLMTSPFFGGQSVGKLATQLVAEMDAMRLSPYDAIVAATLDKYVGECVRNLGDPKEYLAKAREEILAQIEE